tara:strand:+ start:554 stop:1621 length:1068 start_codon:yes stop_codon:yes gene_type:complete
MSESDVQSIESLHEDVYGSKPRDSYYLGLIEDQGPSYIAMDEDGFLAGYITTRLRHSTAEIYIATLAVEPTSPNHKLVMVALIDAVLKWAEEKKAKYITMDTRASKTETISTFKKSGFRMKESGSYKDGESKIKLVKTYKKGKKKFKGKKGISKYTPYVKPEPIPGKYTIRKAETKDLYRITNLHNDSIAKQRKHSYFQKLLGYKPNYFWVAADSNDDMIGYSVCRPERLKGLKKGPYTKLNFVSMAVMEGWRRIGISRDFIEHIFSVARSTPYIQYVYGHVRGTNTNALDLYRSVGFKLKRYGKYEGEDDKIILIKRFRIPSVYPYWLKYGDYIKWFTAGAIAHEAIHAAEELF